MFFCCPQRKVVIVRPPPPPPSTFVQPYVSKSNIASGPVSQESTNRSLLESTVYGRFLSKTKILICFQGCSDSSFGKEKNNYSTCGFGGNWKRLILLPYS